MRTRDKFEGHSEFFTVSPFKVIVEVAHPVVLFRWVESIPHFDVGEVCLRVRFEVRVPDRRLIVRHVVSVVALAVGRSLNACT